MWTCADSFGRHVNFWLAVLSGRMLLYCCFTDLTDFTAAKKNVWMAVLTAALTLLTHFTAATTTSGRQC